MYLFIGTLYWFISTNLFCALWSAHITTASILSSLFSKSFLKETIDGGKTVQKSDDLILCLVQTPKNSPLPNGAYERVSYTGQLYADGDNKFVQLITDSSETTEKTYSYDDIKKMTE